MFFITHIFDHIMPLKITDTMFSEIVKTIQKIQNLQDIRNSDFLTNPIQIIENNVFILVDYLEKSILTGKKSFKMNSLLMTYIFNVFESFNGFRDKKIKLINSSKITENEKKELHNIIKEIEGTDQKPKSLKTINIIRNHFHHDKIEDIKMKTHFSDKGVERRLFVKEYPLIELIIQGLRDAKMLKEGINATINELMAKYNMRDNTLKFNAYCRSHGRLNEIYVLYPEESKDELALYE